MNREEMGLVAEPDEDLALTESEARVWRRKLDSRRKNRLQGSGYVGHEHATARGKASELSEVKQAALASYWTTSVITHTVRHTRAHTRTHTHTHTRAHTKLSEDTLQAVL